MYIFPAPPPQQSEIKHQKEDTTIFAGWGRVARKLNSKWKKKMRLNQIAMLPLGMEGKKEKKSWKKDKKTPETAINKLPLKFMGIIENNYIKALKSYTN